jgi:hypothetical protein
VYVPLPGVPVIAPKEPQGLPPQAGELVTLALSTSDGKSLATEMLSVTPAPPATALTGFGVTVTTAGWTFGGLLELE